MPEEASEGVTPPLLLLDLWRDRMVSGRQTRSMSRLWSAAASDKLSQLIKLASARMFKPATSRRTSGAKVRPGSFHETSTKLYQDVRRT